MSRPREFYSFSITAFSVTTLLLAFVGGCFSDSSAERMVRDANRSNIQRLTNLYTRHQMQRGSQGPKNEQEFRKYIEGVDKETLEKMDIDLAQIDDLFTSERDNQPFEIRYGVRSSFREGMVGLVFEAEGVGGVRQVGFSTIAIKEIEDDSLYSDLRQGKPYVDSDATASNIPGVSR